MNSAPPPPPPHGEVPRGSGLPPGKYDIFIIPPHSSGSGFLYLPSLKPNVNSFAAGFASALILVVLFNIITPAIQSWWYSVRSSGGMGMVMVMLAVGLGAWALGRTQGDGGPGPGGGGGGGGPSPSANTNTGANGYATGAGPPPGASSAPPPGAGGPTPSWQRPTPNAGTTGAGGAKSGWERAREEMRRREEERKAKEAEKKKKEDDDRKLKEAREREAQERLAREKKLAEKLAEAKAEAAKPKGSSYAFSATGERTNPWPGGAPGSRSQPPSPTKRPPPPTAKTYLGTDDDAYSYCPYDKPRGPTHKKSHSSLYSESSYAASQSTSRTTPPPSNRGPYSTKDPDKIVIKAVYSFNNNFIKTPSSQLVSGTGSVTDGLILRITTEGLFIDDDVRGVPQREWDVKAWTMKLVEVWCPSFGPRNVANSSSAAKFTRASPVRRLWNMEKELVATSAEANALLIDLLAACKDHCRLGFIDSSATASSAFTASATAAARSASASPTKPLQERSSNRKPMDQTGEMKSVGLHVLRASIRDQEGKRYVFVIKDEESWKVAVGLQRLRKGTQVRALGVSGMSSGDARSTLENLGWA